jgi:hypothetical protein
MPAVYVRRNPQRLENCFVTHIPATCARITHATKKLASPLINPIIELPQSYHCPKFTSDKDWLPFSYKKLALYLFSNVRLQLAQLNFFLEKQQDGPGPVVVSLSVCAGMTQRR